MKAVLRLAFFASLPLAAQAVTPQLIWNDEFNQADSSAPDRSKWNYDLGLGTPPGWGNHELEQYTGSRSNSLIVRDPAATDGKALALRAQSAGGSYTSARIQTAATFSFKYGRLEARAKVPSGVGCWPAFWALGINAATVGWPSCGEIDVMEWVGQTPSHIKGSLHAKGYSGGHSLNADAVLPNGASYSDAYHVFAVDWYPDQIIFSMDGAVYEVRRRNALPAGSTWPFAQNFYIILNFAVGGNWPGPPNSDTVFPQDYRIDYVRVYALPAVPPSRLVWPPSPPQHLSVRRSSSSGISVSWQAPFSTFGAPLSGYRLERARDPAFVQNLISWDLGTATTYLDRSAHSGAPYFYRVSAVSASGTSDAKGPVGAPRAAANDSKLLNLLRG